MTLLNLIILSNFVSLLFYPLKKILKALQMLILCAYFGQPKYLKYRLRKFSFSLMKFHRNFIFLKLFRDFLSPCYQTAICLLILYYTPFCCASYDINDKYFFQQKCFVKRNNSKFGFGGRSQHLCYKHLYQVVGNDALK